MESKPRQNHRGKKQRVPNVGINPLVPYLWLVQINFESLKISIYMMVSASLAVFAGVRLVKLIPKAVFCKIIKWALTGI
jgi:hypothetical protein